MKQESKIDNRKFIIIYCLIAAILIVMATSYAINTKSPLKSLVTKTIRIDEEAYGNIIFDSSELDFKPILDEKIKENDSNVVHIDFRVGGDETNDAEDIVYDIALVNLDLDCNLLSPYLKWQLYKNNEYISEGSFDYKFDTIKDGRLVLTPIQQDLKEYNKDKTTYDKYDFYMWLSDSCQNENIMECKNKENQSDLIGKTIKGKIEVELYTGSKKALVRKPTTELNTDTCNSK